MTKPTLNIKTLGKRATKSTSRTGDHIQVTLAGYPSRYYKIYGDTPYDAYIDYYIARELNKEKVSLRSFIRAYTLDTEEEKRLKKNIKSKETKNKPLTAREHAYRIAVSRRKSTSPFVSTKRFKELRGLLKFQGMSAVRIDGVEKGLTTNAQRDYARTLLAPMVRDKKLLDILTEPENLEKLRTNTSGTLELLDSYGVVLTSLRASGKSLRHMMQDLSTSGLGTLKELRPGTTPDPAIKDLIAKGWNHSGISSKGTIHTFRLTLYYRPHS